MVEGKGGDLACAVKIVVDVLAALDHQDLLALAHLRLDHYLAVQVDDGVRPADQLGQQLVLLFAAEGNVVDGLELMARMDQPNPY